jgi:hypothetical protein
MHHDRVDKRRTHHERIIPNPGIILIGTIDSGLDALASAGGDFQMTIERID